MATDIFREPASSIPKSDPQIVRVDMEEQQIGGRKSHLPAASKSDRMSIDHVPNAGSRT
jgi:hypothetical protein